MKGKKNKKMKKDNSKLLIIGGVLVFLIIAFFIILLISNKDNKKGLEKSLRKMGEDFYENLYYDQIKSTSKKKTSLLSKFTEVGIKIDLENLERYENGKFSKEIKKFKNNKTGNMCNKVNTKVIIYPKAPYGKKDYKIVTELDCGFEDEK